MHPNFDLEPAAATLEAVAGAITDDQLSAPTPCTDTSVRDLLAHVIGLGSSCGVHILERASV